MSTTWKCALLRYGLLSRTWWAVSSASGGSRAPWAVSSAADGNLAQRAVLLVSVRNVAWQAGRQTGTWLGRPPHWLLAGTLWIDHLVGLTLGAQEIRLPPWPPSGAWQGRLPRDPQDGVPGMRSQLDLWLELGRRDQLVGPRLELWGWGRHVGLCLEPGCGAWGEIHDSNKYKN